MKQIVILSIIVFSCVSLAAQKIEIAVQKGHSAEIMFVTFNEDGKLLASYGKDNLIKLWHVPTGKEMASFISASARPVKSIRFSKGDDFLYVLYDDNSIHTWDVATSSLKSTDKPTSAIAFPDQRKFKSSDSSVSIFVDRFYLKKQNRSTGKTFSKVPIDISQNFTSVAVSEKSQMIIGACRDGKIYIYDLQKGKNIKTLSDHLSSVNSVSLSPAGDFFATASDDRSIIIWDTKTLKLVKRLFGKSYRFESIAFDQTGSLLAAGDEFGKGRIINLQSSRLNVTAFQWHDKKISDIKFSHDNHTIYSAGFDNKLVAFDLQKEKIAKTAKYLNYFNPGDLLLKDLKVYREPYAWLNTVSLSPNDHFLITGGSWREGVARKQPQQLLFKDLNTGSSKRIRTHQGSINSLAFTSNLTFVSGSGNELFEWFYNTADGQFYFRKNKLADVNDIKLLVAMSKDTVVVNAGTHLIGFDLKNEKQLFSFPSTNEINSVAADLKSGVIAFSSATDLLIQNTKSQTTKTIARAHTDKITSIAISPTRPVIATASWDATVKLWNSNTGELIATVIAIGKDDHIIVTPDNYYFGTKNSLKGIGFKYGKQFISPEQYDLRFNRPDIVLARIGFAPANIIKSYQRAYQKRLQKMNFTEQMLSEEIHLPAIEVASAIPLNTAQKTFSFEVKAEDSKYSLDRINVFVNNIPIYGHNGIDLSKQKIQELTRRIETTLSMGKNKIQVSCLNEKGVESLLETFEVDLTGEVKKPSLHLAVISVSNYANKEMNLKYAAKDGRDLANLFGKKNDRYSTITIDTLLNQNATKEKIADLKKKFNDSDVDDDVIVFVSGHGLLDENLDFYFATHDIDFNNPAARGLKYDDLENLLDGIPARKKLLLIDACHSGEVDKSRLRVSQDQSATLGNGQKGTVKTYTYTAVDAADEQYQIGIKSSFELMQELFANVSKGSGSVVISAAAGNSYALESDEWRNGVFTYTLLSGLKNETADQNSDGKITVTELKDFVSREVERLTDGQQKPTSRRENLEFDFVIW